MAGAKQSSGIPDHVQATIDKIASVHERHQRRATRAQRFVERSVSWIATPRFIAVLTIGIVVWVFANLILARSGCAFDPPPFEILQDIGEAVALYITILILVTAQREKEIGEHREQLTLELAILSEQKSAKIIQLIEEARRDNPLISDRHDPVAKELSVPADPEAVLDAIKTTHGAIRGQQQSGELDGS
jgi:uncharacterized membrane protein